MNIFKGVVEVAGVWTIIALVIFISMIVYGVSNIDPVESKAMFETPVKDMNLAHAALLIILFRCLGGKS